MVGKTLLVGVTGGIGSGKSMVCSIYQTLGIPVYHADERAKWLMQNAEGLKSQIIEAFGNDAYVDGDLNRGYLAGRVFHDPEQLQRLNALVHPAVENDFNSWTKQMSGPVMLKEAALLFETGSYKKLDKVVLVTASEKLRIRRTLERDGHRTIDEVRDIISRQWPDEKKIPMADYIISNEGNEMVIHQALKVHEKLMSLLR